MPGLGRGLFVFIDSLVISILLNYTFRDWLIDLFFEKPSKTRKKKIQAHYSFLEKLLMKFLFPYIDSQAQKNYITIYYIYLITALLSAFSMITISIFEEAHVYTIPINLLRFLFEFIVGLRFVLKHRR